MWSCVDGEGNSMTEFLIGAGFVITWLLIVALYLAFIRASHNLSQDEIEKMHKDPPFMKKEIHVTKDGAGFGGVYVDPKYKD